MVARGIQRWQTIMDIYVLYRHLLCAFHTPLMYLMHIPCVPYQHPLYTLHVPLMCFTHITYAHHLCALYTSLHTLYACLMCTPYMIYMHPYTPYAHLFCALYPPLMCLMAISYVPDAHPLCALQASMGFWLVMVCIKANQIIGINTQVSPEGFWLVPITANQIISI